MTQQLPQDVLTPSLVKSLGYWNGLRKGSHAPTLLSLDPFFSAALTESVIAVDVSGAPADYTIWSVGAALAPYLPCIGANKRLAEFYEDPGSSKIWQTFIEVSKLATPYVAAFDYLGQANGVVSTRELYLPFRRPESDEIDDVIVFLEFTKAPVPIDVLGSTQRQPITLGASFSGLQPIPETEPTPHQETHSSGAER
ncbi:MAG: hypothetical protein AAGF94_02155 [Pseudomonadota bacterium]